jgi:hypothetical protein
LEKGSEPSVSAAIVAPTGALAFRFEPDADDGLWKINEKRQAVYAKTTLPLRDQLKAAVALAGPQQKPFRCR